MACGKLVISFNICIVITPRRGHSSVPVRLYCSFYQFYIDVHKLLKLIVRVVIFVCKRICLLMICLAVYISVSRKRGRFSASIRTVRICRLVCERYWRDGGCDVQQERRIRCPNARTRFGESYRNTDQILTWVKINK